MENKPNKQRSHEHGNVFLFVLIGVVLFAALSYTVARGLQGNTSQTMGQRKLAIIASDLMQYTQKVGRGAERVRRKGFSETDISFEDYDASYANANCTTNECKVFQPSGGSTSILSLPQGPSWVDNIWEFHNGHAIDGVGSTCGTTRCTELIMTTHFTNQELCTYINKKLGVANISGSLPSVANITGSKHTGSFAYVNTVGDVAASATISGKTSACVAETTGCNGATGNSCYTFYHVLLAR